MRSSKDAMVEFATGDRQRLQQTDGRGQRTEDRTEAQAQAEVKKQPRTLQPPPLNDHCLSLLTRPHVAVDAHWTKGGGPDSLRL